MRLPPWLSPSLLPVQALLAGTLLPATLAARLLPRRPATPLPTLREPPTATFVIPNYNGIAHGVLLPCLQSLFAHVPADTPVIVVDDASTDESVARLRRDFPQVHIIALPQNRGFLHAANAGLHAATTDAVFLANSDLVFRPGFLPPLLAMLCHAGVFAVTPQLLHPDGTPQAGANSIAWRDGHISIWNELQTTLPPVADNPLPTAYAIGAALLCRRAPAESLGWFDPLYAPHNWEDIDLCHAAWRRGWRTVHVPESTIIHQRHATLSREVAATRRAVHEARNEYLFTWKHLQGPRLLLSHIVCLPARLAARTAAGDPTARAGLWRALPSLPRALAARWRTARDNQWNDKTILAAINEPLLAWQASRNERLRVLFITQEFPWPPASGGRNRNAELLPRLAREHDVLLLAHSDGPVAMPPALSPSLQVRALPRTFRGDPHLGALLPYMLASVTETNMADAIRAALRDYRPDLAVIDSLTVSGYLPLLPAELPVVYVEHDTDMIRLRHSYLGGARSVWAADACRLHAWLRAVGDRATEIVALTAADRRVLRALGIRAPITLVPTCTDTERLRPRLPRTPSALPDLVFAGYFAHAPNAEAIRAFLTRDWPQLRRRFPQLRLRLAGAECPADIVQAATPDSGITVHGYVGNLASFLDGDHLFIAPLTSGGGFRGKLLDAAAMALPVVATPRAAVGLSPGLRAAFRLAPPSRFAAAAAELLTDAEQRRALGERARATLLQMENWEHAAQRFARLLRRAHARACCRPVKAL